MSIIFYSHSDNPPIEWRESIVDFLFKHLDEYGDPREDIRKALEYALGDSSKAGGLVGAVTQGDDVIGAVVVNKTGMEGYIPENILVYIAVHQEHRGKGVGRKLLTEVIGHIKGGVALHVEPDNPALILYQKMGFVNKYLEMRLIRKEES